MTLEPWNEADRGAARQSLDALLCLAGRGDMRAFGQLYDVTVSRVFGLARSILRNHSLAEEVTQDVYFEIWRRASSFDVTRGPAIAWMLTLTHSRAVDRVRRMRVLRSNDDAFAAQSFYPDIDAVTDQAIRTENDGLVHAALAQLTALQRQAIHLTYFLGHTNAEASSLLGVPIPTFKDRVRGALTALRGLQSVNEESRT
ncbi:MAG: sigma-70 family RNA polymerase sigma factor [Nakamurella sp.]